MSCSFSLQYYRYTGKESGPDPVAGRIPNAQNRWWKEGLEENLQLKNIDTIRNELESLFEDRTIQKITFYCGSGVSACFNVAISKQTGLGIPKLYTGSWSEWIKHYPDNIE